MVVRADDRARRNLELSRAVGLAAGPKFRESGRGRDHDGYEEAGHDACGGRL